MIEKQGLQREMDGGTMHRTLFRLVSSKAPLTLRESGVKFTDLKLYNGTPVHFSLELSRRLQEI